jgi:hypothetical protein
MPQPYESYELPVRDWPFQALRDEHGRAYSWLPCMDAPYAWDEDSPIHVRMNAAATCRRDCPALAACALRAVELGVRARGVWGGMVLHRDHVATSVDEFPPIVTGYAMRPQRRPTFLPPLPADKLSVVP